MIIDREIKEESHMDKSVYIITDLDGSKIAIINDVDSNPAGELTGNRLRNI